MRLRWVWLVILGGVLGWNLLPVWAQPATTSPLHIAITPPSTEEDLAVPLQILLLLTLLTFIPALLIAMTSFARIVVVLSFLRQALGVQQMPPNQVLIGLALFLTLFIMAPVGEEIRVQALQPYLAHQITTQAALQRALVPLREFMFAQTREKDLLLFMEIAHHPRPQTREDVPTTALIPAFIISELKTAFQIGFLLYIPFLILDLVVSSVLLSMGMLMLPPVLISLPFKIMLFVVVDGWNLVIGSLVRSFH
ncbi:MAG: flagellar biosynthetic protein FliP [Nitrospinota bacterium]|nr:MAG: flagellar biosynthetic protein FliP [Nitrospinota bacterium]